MKPFVRLLLPAGLALLVVIAGVVGGGCFTSAVVSSANEGTETVRWVSLRVTRCYLNAGQELVVLAEGGAATGGDINSIARKKITIALKLDRLPETAKSQRDSAWVLPVKTVQRGWPDEKFFAKGGFEETSFVEKADAGAQPKPSVVQPDRVETGVAPKQVRVVYQQLIPTSGFPDGLGFAPRFIIPGQTGGRDAVFVIADIKTSRHTGRLLLLPLAVPADVIMIPIVVVAAAAGSV